MVNSESRRFMKPFGWGDRKIHFEAIGQETVKKYLKEKFDVEVISPEPKSFDLGQLRVKESQIPPELLASFQQALGKDRVTIANPTRAIFSAGRSFPDLIRLRSLELHEAPDMVLFPSQEAHLVKIMQMAESHKIALIPFAGGTSVVGGLDACKGENNYTAAIDMTGFKEVEYWDEESRLITVQAGIYGVELEDFLNEKGYTLGHFPQSFEYTTLGGWVSARSSGQNSLLYGSIDKLVFSLKMITPQGDITTPSAPNWACGPDIKQVLIGSEGVWGLVHSCTLKFYPLPAEKTYHAYLFRSFAEASEAARRIVQSEARPAMVRVSDEAETESLLALGSSATQKGFKGWARKVGMRLLEKQGFTIPQCSMMMLGLEGSSELNEFHQRLVEKALKGLAYKDLGGKPGQRWLKDRFYLPYARDAFMDQNLLVDTFETATTWKNRQSLYAAVRQAMVKVCSRQGVKHALFCHLSHIYPSGTSLYFTIICPQKPDAIGQWQEIKEEASMAIVEHGGVISHHHGVGRDHKSYLRRTEAEQKIWQAIKNSLDPCGIMNPGKLL